MLYSWEGKGFESNRIQISMAFELIRVQAASLSWRRERDSNPCEHEAHVFNALGFGISNTFNYSYTIISYRLYIMKDEDVTTIQLKKSIVKELKNIKKYPRETYNETISNLIKTAKESRKTRQYDEFLHKIQQAKMKELWDNEGDEAWENA